jgi:hypothetical protein
LKIKKGLLVFIFLNLIQKFVFCKNLLNLKSQKKALLKDILIWLISYVGIRPILIYWLQQVAIELLGYMIVELQNQ